MIVHEVLLNLEPDLADVGRALRQLRASLGRRNRDEHQAGQNRDHRDDDQQFDQGKSAPSAPNRIAGSHGSRIK
jgi:hypothetical protein